jgi:hypothetical protein
MCVCVFDASLMVFLPWPGNGSTATWKQGEGIELSKVRDAIIMPLSRMYSKPFVKFSTDLVFFTACTCNATQRTWKPPNCSIMWKNPLMPALKFFPQRAPAPERVRNGREPAHDVPASFWLLVMLLGWPDHVCVSLRLPGQGVPQSAFQ